MAKLSKYIIVDNRGLEMPIVFNPILEHRRIAENFGVVSAGWCYRDDQGNFHCHGESVGLKIKSRPEDDPIIEKYLEYNT